MNPAKILAAALLATMQWAHAAPEASPVASAGSFFQVLMGLLVVLGLMAGIAWMLKRFNIARIAGNAPVKVVGGVSVGNRERVLVVEVAGQWIVVGVAAGQVSALASMPRPENASAMEQSPAPNTQPTGNFAGWLKEKMDKRNAQATQQ